MVQKLSAGAELKQEPASPHILPGCRPLVSDAQQNQEKVHWQKQPADEEDGEAKDEEQLKGR